MKDGVRNHIKSIPRIESHYLRAQTTKEFIDGGKTIADLHRDYQHIPIFLIRNSTYLFLFLKRINAVYAINIILPTMKERKVYKTIMRKT